MNVLKFWSWLADSPAPCAETSSDSLPPGSLENIEDLWMKLYFKLKDAHVFDYVDELGDSVGYNTFYKLGIKSENDFAGCLLLASDGAQGNKERSCVIKSNSSRPK